MDTVFLKQNRQLLRDNKSEGARGFDSPSSRFRNQFSQTKVGLNSEELFEGVEVCSFMDSRQIMCKK